MIILAALGCAFQASLCDWQSVGELEWHFSDGRTGTGYTGPSEVYEGRIPNVDKGMVFT